MSYVSYLLRYYTMNSEYNNRELTISSMVYYFIDIDQNVANKLPMTS